MVESEIFSEIIYPGAAVTDYDDRYEEIGRHGSFVLGRLVRHGQIWFVKSNADVSAGVAEAGLRMRKEYEVLLRLNHPGVVRVGWLEEIEGKGLSLIMEMVDGVTLDKFLENATRSERKRLSELLVEAVGYIHSNGVCHLDLKPQNVMVSGRGSGIRLKLVDFGMSDWAGSALFKSPGGTRGFSDPAQFEKDYTATPRSDVYALGKLLKMIGGGHIYSVIADLATNECPDRRPDDALVLADMVGKMQRRRVATGFVWGMITGLAVLTILLLVTGQKPDAESRMPVLEAKELTAGGYEDTVQTAITEPIFNEMPEAVAEEESIAHPATIKSEYEVLVDEWNGELERRLEAMKQIAENDSLPAIERRQILERMNEDIIEDTSNHFRSYIERAGAAQARAHPISWGSIYEPAFEDVRRRMTVIYESLRE